ncbi:MAG: EAL domain-containing protein [Pseudomonadota bacterium]|nr:EAL domain-containing protein [Pseudomonadota bacterium]
MKLDSLLQLDPLTQLPNRSGWMQATQLSIATSEEAETPSPKAIFFIDLDRFKWVNDTLGHEAGDELLMDVARRLLQEVDLNHEFPDMIGRLGGDEFVALIQAPESFAKLELIAQRMIDSLAETIPLKAGEADIGASIGISRYPQDGTQIDTLLGLADLAMYRAKHSGRNQSVLYNPEMTRQIQRRQNLQNKIRTALRHDGFELKFKPVFSTQSQQVVALHAVIKGEDSALQELEPEELNAISDESQLGVKLGRWMVKASLKFLEEINELGLDIPVIVDMRPGHFQQRNLVDWLEDQLDRYEVSPEQLILAMNERCLNSNRFAVQQQLKALDRLGCELAVQDFASGQWSLQQLHDWPINQLHLSTLFVQNMLQNRSMEALAEAVLNLGHTLNKKVVAYGVNSADQQAFLKSYRCDWMHGSWLSEVLESDEVVSVITESRNNPQSNNYDDFLGGLDD